MKPSPSSRFALLLLCLMAAQLPAAQVMVTNLLTASPTNRALTLMWRGPADQVNGRLMVPELARGTTDYTGTFVFSNIASGPYQLTLAGSLPPASWLLLVPDTTDTVNAADLVEATLASPAIFDHRYLSAPAGSNLITFTNGGRVYVAAPLGSGGSSYSSTNPVLYGSLVTYPGTSVPGHVQMSGGAQGIKIYDPSDPTTIWYFNTAYGGSTVARKSDIPVVTLPGTDHTVYANARSIAVGEGLLAEADGTHYTLSASGAGSNAVGFVQASNIASGVVSPFTVVHLPDLQVGNPSDASTNAVNAILSNRVPWNIAACVFSGDIPIPGDATRYADFVIWSNSMERIATVMPIIQTPGNHDYDAYWPRTLTNWNRAFPTTWYTSRSWWRGGFLTNTSSENLYCLVDLPQMPILLLGLEFAPSTNTYLWASNICATFTNRYVMLVTHDWLLPVAGQDRRKTAGDPYEGRGTYGMLDAATPDEAWTFSVQYWRNLASTWNGHNIECRSGGRLNSIGYYGNSVLQVFDNWQTSAGYALTYHRFDPSQNRMEQWPSVVYGSLGFDPDDAFTRFSSPIRPDNGGGLVARDKLTVVQTWPAHAVPAAGVAQPYNPQVELAGSNSVWTVVSDPSSQNVEFWWGTNNTYTRNTRMTYVRNNGSLITPLLSSNVFWGSTWLNALITPSRIDSFIEIADQQRSALSVHTTSNGVDVGVWGLTYTKPAHGGTASIPWFGPQDQVNYNNRSNQFIWAANWDDPTMAAFTVRSAQTTLGTYQGQTIYSIQLRNGQTADYITGVTLSAGTDPTVNGTNWRITSDGSLILNGSLTASFLNVVTQRVGTLELSTPVSIASGGTGQTNAGNAGQALVSVGDGSTSSWGPLPQPATAAGTNLANGASVQATNVTATNVTAGTITGTNIKVSGTGTSVSGALTVTNQAAITGTGFGYFASLLVTNCPPLTNAALFQPASAWGSNVATNAVLTNAIQGTGITTNGPAIVQSATNYANRRQMGSGVLTNIELAGITNWRGAGSVNISTNAGTLVFTGSGSSSSSTAIRSATNYPSLGSDQMVAMDAKNGPLTNTLCSAATNAGKIYIVKKCDDTTNCIQITPQSGQTIDGMSNLTLWLRNDYVAICSDATNWWISDSSFIDNDGWINKTAGLRQFKSALASLRSKTNQALVHMVCIGDSITEGYYADDRITNSFVGKLRGNLWQYGISNAGYGIVFPHRTDSSYADKNVTFGGSWSTGSASDGYGGGPWDKGTYATGTNNYVDVTNVIANGIGVLWHINGFTATTTNRVSVIASDFSSSNYAGVITAASGSTTYRASWFETNITTASRVRLQASASAQFTFFDGFILGDTHGTNGLMIHNCGYNGKKVSEYLGGTDWSANMQWTEAIAPALTLIMLDSNDSSGGTDPNSYRTNLTEIVKRARLSGSVVIVGSLNRTGSSAGVQENLQNIGRTIAMNYNCAYWSLRKIWGDDAMGIALGYTTDNVHPVNAGHQYIADQIAKTLFSTP
jgi:lysophospholipase L1-like esterase